jgi:sacsin
MPHILSGSHLAILDPQHCFREDGGVRLNIVDNALKYKDHLAAFDAILPHSQWGQFYHGSIFRCPLRTSPSALSNKSTSVDEIAELLRSFAREELGISLLFLRNISAIEIYEVTACGDRVDIAAASVTRSETKDYRGQYETHKATIRFSSARSTEDEEWRVIHAPSSEIQAVELLDKRLGLTSSYADRTILGDKLNPTIDLAIPLNSSTSSQNGRLFTFLPLPLKTGFPVHINALFSLTQSRQNLRNADEVGIVKNSEDR